MEDEAQAARHYTELAKKIPIPEIQAILCQLAADEERHYQCFAEAKMRFCGADMAQIPELTQMQEIPTTVAPPPSPAPAPLGPGGGAKG
jgi:hypothetical protein